MSEGAKNKGTGVVVSAEVEGALKHKAPVVALESTIISHGLPYPDNLELAREAEDLVRKEEAIPATIGVIDGAPRVGIDPTELELLATENVPKLSVRDLPIAVAKGSHGATTVAATAHLGALVGVRLFATGGVGGVHRGARESWDVSADLAVLSRTPMAIVSSGIKSILDIPGTLEYLETLSVPVIGFRTKRFPGFYLTDSGYPLDWSVDDEAEAARAIESLAGLGLEQSSLVIANPIPEDEQLDPDLHDRVLRTGLDELERRNIRGKEVTPFLLDHFLKGTDGESLRVNKQIIRNNVRLAARIAGVLSTLATDGKW